MGLCGDDIVAAAFELLDEQGLDRLSMRRVADRLTVRVSSLYWHVTGKQHLLAELANRVLLDVRFPLTRGEEWERPLRDLAHRLRTAVLAHRDGARLVTGYSYGVLGELRLMEGCLGLLHARGIPLPAAAYATNTVLSYVMGFVLREQVGDLATRPDPQLDVPATGASVPGTFPLSVRWSAIRPATQDLAFATGLDHVLVGIRARLFDDLDPLTA